ncbi:MAG: hypothetical protein ACKO7G_00870, partial [Gammaproteobacteria bacterium]
MTPRQPPRSIPPRTPSRRAQQGFIASAAQVTLALVSMVVGATALSMEGARQEAADQIAHVHASYLTKAGADLESALARAAVDSGLSRNALRGTVTLDAETASRGTVALFDRQLGYGSRPRWPSGLLAEGVEGAGSLRWADTDGQVVEVPGIDLAVCRRFNEMLQGSDPQSAPPADLDIARRERGWTQGCWAAEGTEAGTWFMEAFADTHCRGRDFLSGDRSDSPPSSLPSPPP